MQSGQEYTTQSISPLFLNQILIIKLTKIAQQYMSVDRGGGEIKVGN